MWPSSKLLPTLKRKADVCLGTWKNLIHKVDASQLWSAKSGKIILNVLPHIKLWKLSVGDVISNVPTDNTKNIMAESCLRFASAFTICFHSNSNMWKHKKLYGFHTKYFESFCF